MTESAVLVSANAELEGLRRRGEAADMALATVQRAHTDAVEKCSLMQVRGWVCTECVCWGGRGVLHVYMSLGASSRQHGTGNRATRTHGRV